MKRTCTLLGLLLAMHMRCWAAEPPTEIDSRAAYCVSFLQEDIARMRLIDQVTKDPNTRNLFPEPTPRQRQEREKENAEFWLKREAELRSRELALARLQRYLSPRRANLDNAELDKAVASAQRDRRTNTISLLADTFKECPTESLESCSAPAWVQLKERGARMDRCKDLSWLPSD
jgi:hypothetical protein